MINSLYIEEVVGELENIAEEITQQRKDRILKR